MKSEWTKKKFSDIADFNPRETIKKGAMAKKIPMDVLRPFCRDISYYVEESFSGGTKFRNGDTIMARITPCLENGKTAQVSILNNGEVGFGSTEYIVFRAKEGIADKDYLYYLVCSPEVREPAIKSMVGSSGRQRVQTDVVKNLELAIPPLTEQEKIGSFLKLIDDKIVLNDRINNNLSLEWQTDLGPEWQEVQKKYLHTIGNLTLTAYNSEMSDRPFLDKMDMPGGFKESALRLNKYVVLQNEWNEKHIQERANELAKKAEAIWPYPTLTAAELAPYQAEEKTVQKYSLESYDVNAFTRMLFESLDKRIMNLSPAVKKEYKKLYVAYKLDTNFVDIVFQKQRLRISINMKFSEINDPNGICKDITGLGRWGNGDVELFMEHQDELDQIMEIVKQSYDAQAE